MVFGQPQFLWAFALLLIPIIVHLLQFKKQNVYYFPGVFRLIDILRVSEKRRNIKKWLLLFSRLLAFFFLVIYFADPQWKSSSILSKSSAPRYILFVDASPSMHVARNGIVPLQNAKKSAIEWVNHLPNNAEIWVLHDLRSMNENQWKSKSNAVNAVRSIQNVTYPYSINQVYKVIESSLNSNANGPIQWVLFSDCYRDFFGGLKTIPIQKNAATIVKVSSEKLVNFAIDSAYISEDVQYVYVRISRNTIETDNSQDNVVKLLVNDRVEASESLEFEEGIQEKMVKLKFKTLPENGFKIQLSEDDFNSDNALYCNLPAKISRPVIFANSGRVSSIDKLIKIQPNYFSLDSRQSNSTIGNPISKTTNTSDVNAISKNGDSDNETPKTIIFSLKPSANWESIENVVNEKNRVIIYPFGSGLENLFKGVWIESDKENIRISNSGLNEPLFQSAFTDPIQNNAALPKIKRYFQLDESEKVNIQVHLSLNNGEPLLISKNLNNGTVFIWLSDSRKGLSDFEKSAWFTPLVTELMLDRNAQFGSIYGDIFSNSLLPLPRMNGFDLQRPVIIKNSRGAQISSGLQLSNGRLSLGLDFDYPESGFFLVVDQDQKTTLGLNIPRKEKKFEEPEKEEMEELERRGWSMISSDKLDWKKEVANSNNSWFDLIVYLIILFFLSETLLIMPWFASKEVNSHNQS